jgi:hypothetical protein
MPGPPAGQTSYIGKLVRAGRIFESGQTYRLESAQPGMKLPLTYVIGGPGVNLEPHVGQVLELWGTGRYDGEIRGNVFTALRVMPK